MPTYDVELKGITRYIWHNPGIIGKDEPPKKEKGKIAATKLELALQAAPKYVYRNGHGLFHPARALRMSVIEGCKMERLKYEVMSGKPALGRYLQALIAITPDDLLFGTDDWDEIFFSQPKTQSGTRVPLYRPSMLPGWELACQVTWHDERLAPSLVEKSVRAAGWLVGIGAWRGEGHGRFNVTKFAATA